MKKEYLADGVYADFDPSGQIVLTTEDGTSVTNTIYLDVEVIQALLHYIEKLTGAPIGSFPK